MLVLLLVQRTAGEEVVHASVPVLLANSLTLGLLGVVVVASDILEEVHWPSTKLLNEERDGGVDWSLLHQLVHFVKHSTSASGVLLTGTREENHVTLHVSRSFVVLAVGDFPGEVWHQQSRVAEPSDGVIERLAGREGLMSTLVSQDPQTSGEEALHDGVDTPEDRSQRV